MLEKPQVFSLYSNNQSIAKISYHAERKHKSLPDTVNVYVAETAKEFSKTWKEFQVFSKRIFKNLKAKKRKEWKKTKLKRLTL